MPTGSMDATVWSAIICWWTSSPTRRRPDQQHLLPYTEPKRGDIIVFRYPMDIRQNFVKRVMGVPGDRIHIVDKVVYLNGKALTEPYAQHIDPHVEPYRDNFPSQPDGPVADRAQRDARSHVQNGELVVPAGQLFRHGRQSRQLARQPLLGLRAAREYHRQAAGHLLVLRCSDRRLGRRQRQPLLDLAKNFFVKTRWNRTFKLVRGIPIE